MAENGEEKLLAVARHIAKSLGHDETAADDIFQIFSNFDCRLSREKFSEKIGGEDDHRGGCATLEHTLKSVDRQISQFVGADHPIWADSVDSSAFLDIIDELTATIRHWTPMAREKNASACLAHADDLMQRAMFRLEDELRLLMERGGESFELSLPCVNGESTDSEDEDDDGRGGDDHQIPTANPVTDYDIVIDALPSGTINDLHEIAKRMVTAGFGKECSHVYSSCRREYLEESMSRLGVQRLSSEDIQKMPWPELEDEIERWNKAVKVALRILFPSERFLCDRVFFGFSAAADLSFMEVCRGATTQLMNFADAVAIGSRAHDRLFKILDVFETWRDLIPEFDSVFSDQYCSVLRNGAIAIWKRLGEAIRVIFMELENLIRRDPAKAAVPGGGLHPITRYVMNYLRAACESRQTLEHVFEDNFVPTKDYTDCASSSSLSVQMAWMMELLEKNLEVKSKIYRDTALCSVFMMNNERYILQKVIGSELESLLGDDWVRKHMGKIGQYRANYVRSSWNKVIAVLTSTMAANTMKEKLKLFNLYFDETCEVQTTWVIFDKRARDELVSSVVESLLPAYRNFLVRFQNAPEIGRLAEKDIKYTTADIDARLRELFQGRVGSADGRK